MRPELFLKPNKFISLLLRKPANTGLRNFASETGHTSGLRNNRVCEFRKLEPQCSPLNCKEMKIFTRNTRNIYVYTAVPVCEIRKPDWFVNRTCVRFPKQSFANQYWLVYEAITKWIHLVSEGVIDILLKSIFIKVKHIS